MYLRRASQIGCAAIPAYRPIVHAGTSSTDARVTRNTLCRSKPVAFVGPTSSSCHGGRTRSCAPETSFSSPARIAMKATEVDAVNIFSTCSCSLVDLQQGRSPAIARMSYIPSESRLDAVHHLLKEYKSTTTILFRLAVHLPV